MFKIAALTTLALGIACMAQPIGGPGNRQKSHLSLTDSQLQNLRTMREQNRQANQASMEELHAKERALRDQLKAGSTDAAALGRMMIDIESARKRVDAARQSFHVQAVASLTPDQRAQLKSLEEARKLMPAVREAEMMGFLDPPADGEIGPAFGPGFGNRAGGPPPAGPGPNGFNRNGRRPGGPQRFDRGVPRFDQ